MDLQFTSLPSQPGLLFLAAGVSYTNWLGAALPVNLAGFGLAGCKIWITPGPDLGRVLPHPGGAMNLTLAIPPSPVLAGQRFALQALVFDPAASNGVGAVSNAGIATLR